MKRSSGGMGVLPDGLASLHVGCDLRRQHLESLVDPLVERGLQPEVEEGAGRREHQRHRQREGEREAQADRQPAHRRR